MPARTRFVVLKHNLRLTPQRLIRAVFQRDLEFVEFVADQVGDGEVFVLAGVGSDLDDELQTIPWFNGQLVTEYDTQFGTHHGPLGNFDSQGHGLAMIHHHPFTAVPYRPPAPAEVFNRQSRLQPKLSVRWKSVAPGSSRGAMMATLTAC